jgi:tetratricopeptide (TPR) repeat protein
MKVVLRWWLQLQASLALTFGMKARAIELYRQILAMAPKDGPTAATLGSMLMESGDAAGATDVFLRALEANPDYADGWFNLGYIYEQRENSAEAERCFRRALELNPQHDRAWYGLALVLIRGDRLSEAVAALKENTKLQPFSPYGFYQLGMTYHHLGEAGDAWRVYEQLKLFEPKYAATLKRDLEATAPRHAARPINESPKEAITAST